MKHQSAKDLVGKEKEERFALGGLPSDMALPSGTTCHTLLSPKMSLPAKMNSGASCRASPRCPTKQGQQADRTSLGQSSSLNSPQGGNSEFRAQPMLRSARTSETDRLKSNSSRPDVRRPSPRMELPSGALQCASGRSANGLCIPVARHMSGDEINHGDQGRRLSDRLSARSQKNMELAVHIQERCYGSAAPSARRSSTRFVDIDADKREEERARSLSCAHREGAKQPKAKSREMSSVRKPRPTTSSPLQSLALACGCSSACIVCCVLLVLSFIALLGARAGSSQPTDRSHAFDDHLAHLHPLLPAMALPPPPSRNPAEVYQNSFVPMTTTRQARLIQHRWPVAC